MRSIYTSLRTHPSARLCTKVDDPILGPKEVRPLLIFRGVSGCVSSPFLSLYCPSIDLRTRFFGLFGIYYSLQYLSLSDATVLTFLSPLCTAIAGALFLKEKMRRTQALAGRKRLFGLPTQLFIHEKLSVWLGSSSLPGLRSSLENSMTLG